MAFSHHKKLLQLYFLIFWFLFIFGTTIDTIRVNESVSDAEALISNGNRFKLSFFSPPNSRRRYVGIMYNLPVMTIVWIANRNEALNDSMGKFEISSDSNLVILDGRKKIVWSIKLSGSIANASAVLLNTGNLVMKDKSNNMYCESFNHASDSWLEHMKISTDLNGNEKNVLTSWTSPDDPTPGSFSMSIEPLDFPQAFIWMDGYPYVRSGPWNGQLFTGMPHMLTDYNIGANVVRDSPGTTYLIYSLSNSSLFLYCILTSLGNFEKEWSDKTKGWDVTWSLILSDCDTYGKCGPFGSCNAHQNPICSCFHGFMPKNRAE
ncbi:hypothetical protein C2S53_009944 [Perilla frutescens var. hirtella]|uniref:Bulb-type lectin domain-containing protein n=1 Tax=Perilla frutescens var. hirtella TaxID=608512 RepID=A0AAD4J6R9_PERFH|nr:hypothetical protein C2S53_009944 [Perilla frutescens var. hirtella]